MADISAEITDFKNAVYGEDVRDALVSLANKLNNSIANYILDMNSEWTTYRNNLNDSWTSYQNAVDDNVNGLETAWTAFKNTWDNDWNSSIIMLHDTDDVNVLKNGRYIWFTSKGIPQNIPLEKNGILWTFGADNESYDEYYKFQICVLDTHVSAYYRYHDSSKWSSWMEFASPKTYYDGDSFNLLPPLLSNYDGTNRGFVSNDDGSLDVWSDIKSSANTAEFTSRTCTLPSGYYYVGLWNQNPMGDTKLRFQIYKTVDGAVGTSMVDTASVVRISVSKETTFVCRIYYGITDEAYNCKIWPFIIKEYIDPNDFLGKNSFADNRLRSQMTDLKRLLNNFNIKDDFLMNRREWKYRTLIFDGDPLTIRYNTEATSSVRRSLITTFNEDTQLFLLNPKNVFRIYWIENNTTLNTAWSNTWTCKANIEYGIIIKVRNDSTFDNMEKPEDYLVSTQLYNKPKECYLTELETTINTVKSKMDEPCLCFLVSTDHHHFSVQGTLVKRDTINDLVRNMNYFIDHVKVDGHICLGDLTDMKWTTDDSKFNAYGIYDTSASNIDAIFRDLSKYAINTIRKVNTKLLFTPGNHDDNRYINRDNLKESTSIYDYTKQEMYNIYMADNNIDCVPNLSNNGLDYYVDYPKFKIRLFALHAAIYHTNDDGYNYAYNNAWWYGYANETYTWFSNQLNNVPSDWSVILISHVSPYYTHNADNANYPNYGNISNAIQSFINNGGNFIACLYGHSHCDWSATTPWLDISFDCSKSYSYSPSYSNMPNAVHNTNTYGTDTDECWSVVLIKPISRKIEVVRFGAGNDATYNY